jgi:plasmid stabilization system protein ParE
VTANCVVEVTANFEQNLEEVEAFLLEAGTPQVFDALIGELLDHAIPNLRRFPEMGRRFLDNPGRSVEAVGAARRLDQALRRIGDGADLREYVTRDFLVLYAYVGSRVILLSVRHHRQLSFDLQRFWTRR